MKRSILIIFTILAMNICISQETSKKVMQLCLIERIKEGNLKRINFSPYSESIILDLLVSDNFEIKIQSETPLISKEVIEYSVVSTTGRLSAITGYVHLESGPDGTLKFTSDKGANVVLKTEVNSTHWIIDKKKVIESSKKSGVNYLMIVEVESEDISESLLKKQQYGSQRSINTTMSAILLDTKTGKTLVSNRDNVTKMNAVVTGAISDAVEYLAIQLLKKLNQNKELK